MPRAHESQIKNHHEHISLHKGWHFQEQNFRGEHKNINGCISVSETQIPEVVGT